jgi:GT2 family glycosyltransferase
MAADAADTLLKPAQETSGHEWSGRADVAPDKIDVSIIICTYRRYDYLETLIPKAAALSLAGGGLEVLIVDNTDDEAVVADFYARVPLPEGFRLIRSTPPGLSRARNVGLKEARGRYALFLDDDAEPSTDWAQAIYDVFEDYPDAAVVGGPILPVWPSARPEWLSSRYEGCLTMLDAGNVLRKLQDWEHAYGANIAVHVERTQAIGGFPENLGRKKSGSLLSNEELLIQNDLRAQGYGVYYAPEALVFHHAHPERLKQGWMRRRMAWQVVSDAMSWDAKADSSAVLARAAKAAGALGIDPSFLNLLRVVEQPEHMDAQLDLIVALVEALLSSNAELSDEAHARLTATIQSETRAPAVAPPPPAHPAVPLNLKPGGLLFMEVTPGHDYLFDAYSAMENVSILKQEFDPWRSDPAGIEELMGFLEAGLSSAASTGSAIVFVTMDYWARTAVADKVARRIIASGVRVFGMLHRFPPDPEVARHVRELADVLEGVIVLSPDFKSELERRYSLTNVTYVPHHAVTSSLPPIDRETARRRLMIPADRHVIALVGEAREGKGVEVVLDALPLIKPESRDKLFFLFAGKSTEEMRTRVSQALRASRLSGRVDLRQADDRRVFAVLNELEYQEMIAAADSGLLIYQGPQRVAMSGVMPCYVTCGANVIATANSYVGQLVARYDLGRLLIDETPEELAAVLDSAAASGRRKPTWRSEQYRQQVSNEAVLKALEDLMRSPPTETVERAI